MLVERQIGMSLGTIGEDESILAIAWLSVDPSRRVHAFALGVLMLLIKKQQPFQRDESKGFILQGLHPPTT